jgi:hypothetical protein
VSRSIVEGGAKRFSTQVSDSPISLQPFKWLIRRSDRGDESMPKLQDILDEIFSLLQQQMQVRSGSIPAAQAGEYQKRAARIDQLLNSLSTQSRVGMAVEHTEEAQGKSIK